MIKIVGHTLYGPLTAAGLLIALSLTLMQQTRARQLRKLKSRPVRSSN